MSIKNISITAVPILKRAGVKKSQIFGSFARGDQTEDSDIDLLVELPEKASLFDLAALKHELEDNLQKKVDLVSYDALNERVKPFVEKDLITIL